MDFPTASELAEIGIRELVSTPKSPITVQVARTEATDANILMATSAAMADEVVGQEVKLEAGVFLDSCKGQALDRYLWDRYRLKRPGATPAFNSAFFSTDLLSTAAFEIPQGTKVQTPDGVVYLTTAAAMYPKGIGLPAGVPPGAGTGIYVPCRSVLAGSSQRSRGGVSLSVLDTIPGAVENVLASFFVASSGGDDQMDDDPFRQMGRDFFANATLGTLAAIEARAKRVPGVATARAFEVLSEAGRPERFVNLVISDRYTPVYADLVPTPPTYQAQSQLLARAVQDALVDTRGAGMAVQVTMGQVVLVPIQLDLRFQAGSDFEAVAFAARVAIYNYTNSLRGGESWVYADAEKKLQVIPGLFWSGSEIRAPLGDIVPKNLQLIRTDMRLVQVSNVSPEQQLGVA